MEGKVFNYVYIIYGVSCMSHYKPPMYATMNPYRLVSSLKMTM